MHRFNADFFRRLHDRASDLRRHGAYVSIMLFELYGFWGGENMDGQNLLDGNIANNSNGIEP